jgi:hypothetical protein
MTVKPGDFFFGLLEFLAFIVPGMILFATIPEIVTNQLPDFLKIIGNENVTPFGWVSFILLSYVYGHFIHHFSALLLNPVYKRTYFIKKKKKHNLFIENVENSIKKELPDYTDMLRIADAYVRTKQPSITSELEKYEANSKLFRSLCLLSLYVCFYPNLSISVRIVLIIISVLSFSKFANQRWTRRLVVYEYFSILIKTT